MKIAIFGSAGYIGSSLCNQLLNMGYQVKAIDNFYKGDCDSLIPYCSNPNFEFEFGDITNPKDVQENIKNVDGIVLLSALVGAPICKKYPALSKSVNVEGTKNVIKYKPKDVPLFFASTGSVYGKLEDICTENSQTNPQSEYGLHKLEAEKIVLDSENTYAYRFSTAYGISPSLRVNLLINDLVMQAYLNRSLVIFQADFKRSFIHVQDLCWSFVFGLQRYKNFEHRLFNVGDPEGNFTKREIAEKIKEKIPCSIFYEDISEDPDQRNYSIDFQRFLSTGWTPSISMEEGIKELIKTAPLLNMRNRYE